MKSNIEKFIILKSGWLVFGVEIKKGIISYSHDEGRNWHRKRLNANNYIEIISMDSPKNLVIAVIDYNILKNIYILFNFSHEISSLHLILDRMCGIDDFEYWYILRD
ncbi:hypothetical protein RF11_16289 [Thelohanellus kitauei]|uniref:Sortilin N-terminal domain-containing protein n=1 Tax=Thelohanellus kitauei TaxID=669202 RepID=A0A0C2M0E1_THEKT|nr:hypothetical protein RF11_16289 [Thelohanellus kitauei]